MNCAQSQYKNAIRIPIHGSDAMSMRDMFLEEKKDDNSKSLWKNTKKTVDEERYRQGPVIKGII